MSKVLISPVRVVVEAAPVSLLPVTEAMSERIFVVRIRGLTGPKGRALLVTEKPVTSKQAAKIKATIEEHLDVFRKPRAKAKSKKSRPKAKTSWERISSGDTV